MAPHAELFDLGNVLWTRNELLPVLAGKHAKFVGFEKERSDVSAGYWMLRECLELLEAVLCEEQVGFWDHVM